MHGGDDRHNVCPQRIVIIHAKGLVGVAQQPVGWARAQTRFDQQAIGGQLHHVGFVGLFGTPGWFDFDGDDTLAAFEQVIRLAQQAVFMGNQGLLVGQCVIDVTCKGGRPRQARLLAGALGDIPQANYHDCQHK